MITIYDVKTGNASFVSELDARERVAAGLDRYEKEAPAKVEAVPEPVVEKKITKRAK